MGKRKTWLICLLLILAYIFLSYIKSKQLLHHSILTWHKANIMSTSHGLLHVWVFVTAVLGALALVMVIPTVVMVGITVVVLLSCCGKQDKDLMLECKRLTVEIFGVLIKGLIMNNTKNVFVVTLVVLGCLVLFVKVVN